jgi:galactokinase
LYIEQANSQANNRRAALKDLIAKTIETYKKQFGKDNPVIAKAPGRVNLIGEHTDYNDGFVFPVAIDKAAFIVGNKTEDKKVRMYSMMSDEMAEHPVEGFKHDDKYGWANYILGVIQELQKLGHKLPGAEIVNSCTVPLASGLSSSAALEVAVSTFFEKVAGLKIPAVEVAKLCQRAENKFVGVNCGIMDQFISRLGKKGTALFIDCRSFEYEHVPFDNPDVQILICNTGVKRRLVASEYNTRRSECEQGASFFGKKLNKPVKALRDVTFEEFKQYESELPENVRKRCRHVIAENERVLKVRDLLKKGDYQAFGKLLYDSHASLRDDYEVSSRELDIMVDILKKQKGVLGARMTGAGFGGCTVSIFNVKNVKHQKTIVENVSKEYAEKTGIMSDIFFSLAESGASVL